MSALRRTESARAAALEATVSNPDPDELTVTIEDFDGSQRARHAWPAVNWPRSATAVPARGDRCLVVMSEVGGAWVVAAEWTGELQWTDLSPSSGWSAASEGPRPGCATSPTGWVTLRGVVTTGAQPRTDDLLLAALLPEQARPAKRRSFAALIGGGVAALVHVHADGRLRIGAVPSSAPAGATVTLDGIAYQAED